MLTYVQLLGTEVSSPVPKPPLFKTPQSFLLVEVGLLHLFPNLV